MLKFHLLNKDQVSGKNRLEILNESEMVTTPTDFAFYKSLKQGVPNRCQNYWINCNDSNVFAGTVDCYGRNLFRVNPRMEGFGLRPVIEYESIKPFAEVFYEDSKSLLVKFGEYPQDFADRASQISLDNLYSQGFLQTTNKSNVFKYKNSLLFRDDINHKWITTSPIMWSVDKKSGLAISDRIIDASKKNFKEVVSYLENDFGKIIFPEEKIKEYNALVTYSRLQKRKVETESKLDSINQMLKHLDEEIAILKRKKN